MYYECHAGMDADEDLPKDDNGIDFADHTDEKGIDLRVFK